MKHIELFWNWLYFCVYEWNKITQLAINRVAEALVSCFVPNAKRYIRMPPLQFWLLQTSISDVMMLAFTALLVWTLFNFASILCPRFSLVPLDKWTFCLITGIPCYLINHLLLWRKDKYLKYFERFSKTSSKLKRIWLFISILFLPLAWLMFIFSMMIM